MSLPPPSLEQRKLVQVPDVVGMPLKKALLLLTQAGLSIEDVLYKESYEERDIVLEQKPPRRQMVYAGTSVLLSVSRESYIKWLPALYQRSDVTGKNFVRDILWIVQHLFGSIEERLEIIHTYFDPYETPEDFLPWLAGWSAMVLEADWPVNHKRKLIKKAMELYRLRGTVRGLSLFISLFTGFEPTLRENEWPFAGFRIGVTSAIGIDSVILPPVDKSRAFMVIMPHRYGEVIKEKGAQAIIRLLEIIELEKPAHTSYMLKFEEPPLSVEEREFFRIGVRSGINVGDEIVTPLPISEETGEKEYPPERIEPPTPPDPSVYELFATRKRELPRFKKGELPAADAAPVEGREIGVLESRGFEDRKTFQLEDIMRELLKASGEGEGEGGEGEGGEGGAPVLPPDEPGPAPASGGTEAAPAEEKAAEEKGPVLSGAEGPPATMDVDWGAGTRSGAKAPRIEFELEGKEKPQGPPPRKGPGRPLRDRRRTDEPKPAAPSPSEKDEGDADLKVEYGQRPPAGRELKVEIDRPLTEGGDDGDDDKST
jgi:phage tail-like protein